MQGISIVKHMSGPSPKSLALAVLAISTLALGACGRKGGLDLPPDAAAAPTAQVAQPTDPNAKTGAAATPAAQTNVFSTANPSDRTQYAPKLPPKRIVIDPILD